MIISRSAASIRTRLLVSATVFQVFALILSGSAIDNILSTFVVGQVEKQLDAQVLALASAVSVVDEGTPTLKRDLDTPPFDRVFSGWYWQVSSETGTLTSRSLMNRPIDTERSPITGPRSELLRLKTRQVTLPDLQGAVSIAVAAPESEIQQPLAAARRALCWSLVALAVAFSSAMFAQVWLGLRPLRLLTSQLNEVRAGRRSSLPPGQVTEVSDLADEVNALIVQNRHNLDRARSHIANLAHGLKTPLAALSMRLERGHNSSQDVALVELMDRRISHHLRRARAMAGENYRDNMELAPRVTDLLNTFRAIYKFKNINAEKSIPLSLDLRCDQQDFDEILGNLLDNAFKWGKSVVLVKARYVSNQVELTVEDDGPGLSPENFTKLGKRGERLDEEMPGTGFGLAITSELVSLYGGTLELKQSILGGLLARVTMSGFQASPSDKFPHKAQSSAREHFGQSLEILNRSPLEE